MPSPVDCLVPIAAPRASQPGADGLPRWQRAHFNQPRRGISVYFDEYGSESISQAIFFLIQRRTDKTTANGSIVSCSGEGGLLSPIPSLMNHASIGEVKSFRSGEFNFFVLFISYRISPDDVVSTFFVTFFFLISRTNQQRLCGIPHSKCLRTLCPFALVHGEVVNVRAVHG